MIDTRLIRSSELGIAGRGNQRLVDIINALGSNVFFEGSSGKIILTNKHSLKPVYQYNIKTTYIRSTDNNMENLSPICLPSTLYSIMARIA